MDKPVVGFIGLGIMGSRLAAHLLDAGYRLVVYDVVPSRTETVRERGARVAQSCKETAERSEIVISMVIGTNEVKEAYLAADGVLAGAKWGAMLIDMTTASPRAVATIAKAAEERGCHLLDAPVSGGDVGAEQASLSIMVGGDEGTFQKVRPVLELFGVATYCGPSGSGQVVKACNQIQVSLALIGMAEALVLGVKAGVDPLVIIDVLSRGYAQTRVMDVRGARVIRGDFVPGGRCSIQHKDLNIIRETARELGCCLPASALAHELYSAAMANGWADLDHSAIIKVIELLSNMLDGSGLAAPAPGGANHA
jgi:2-hydroxy-3-oxopropionate reductase